ncbi:MAG: ATP-binding protein [Salinivirgaceae bacterium]
METSIYPQSFRELNILIRISQDIISTLEFEKVLQIISDGMSELLEIETAAIYVLENQNELLLGATTPALPPEMPIVLRRALLEDHPYIQKTITEAKPIRIADTTRAKLSPAEQSVVEMRNLKSILYFPFIQKGEVLGVLILGTCNKSRLYSEHEINLGQTISNQFSVALQNARLHEDLKNHKENLEKLVQEKTHDLKAAIEELKTANNELFDKNEIILSQNNELKATLQHLKDTQTQLLQAEKMAYLGTLTSGVTHEIKNPLNFIMGSYLGLEKHFKSYPANYNQEVEVLLSGLLNGVERISAIVNSLNQFSQKYHGLNELCSVHSIIDNCLLMVSNKLSDAIKIKKNYTNDQCTLMGNAANLNHALINILTNAIQAIEQNGKISIQTQVLNDQKKIRIDISDTGKGIGPENLGRITEPFFTTKEPGKGTGLGLAISYRIIEEHCGTLAFESELGKGTRVHIELPAHNL